MQVYLLVVGEYSDFRVVAAFTNKEKAYHTKEWLLAHDQTGSWDIQELEADHIEGMQIDDDRKPYCFEFDLKRNPIAPYPERDLPRQEYPPIYGSYGRKGSAGQKNEVRMIFNHSLGEPGWRVSHDYTPNSYAVWCCGCDEDHAFKIATEMLQKFIAEQTV